MIFEYKLKRKHISLDGAQTQESRSIILEQYIFRTEIEKHFRSFLVQMKTAKSPFQIWDVLQIVTNQD